MADVTVKKIYEQEDIVTYEYWLNNKTNNRKTLVFDKRTGEIIADEIFPNKNGYEKAVELIRKYFRKLKTFPETAEYNYLLR